MKKLIAALFFALFSLVSFAAVDINTATVKELETVKGIGPKTAQAIVDYRDANGTFQSVEDLTKVKGIGPKSLAKMQSELTVAQASTAEQAATEVKEDVKAAAKETKVSTKKSAKKVKAEVKEATGTVKEEAKEVQEAIIPGSVK